MDPIAENLKRTLKPGQTIEVEARDEVSDSVRLKGKDDQRMTIGARAASTPGGGTAPYTVAWDGGGTALQKMVTAAGTYAVTLTDAAGCTLRKEIVVPATLGAKTFYVATTGSNAGAGTLVRRAAHAPPGVVWLQTYPAATFNPACASTKSAMRDCIGPVSLNGNL